MKRIIRILTISYILVMLCIGSVFAETVNVDAFTGEDIAPDGSSTVSQITPTCRYDSKINLYIFTTGAEDNTSILCDTANCQVVRHAVAIYPESNVSIALYKDGYPMTEPNLSHIDEVGSYRVFAIDPNGNANQIVDFMIIGESTNAISTFTAPDGFTILSASRDGEYLSTGDYSFNMEEEGNYVIEYICSTTGVRYTLETNIDRTAPTLALTALNGGYSVAGPVDISDREFGCTMTVLKNGKQIMADDVLTDAGDYEITLTDKAGNVNVYNFTIKTYFDLNAWVVVLILAAAVIYVTLDIMNARRKFRVR